MKRVELKLNDTSREIKSLFCLSTYFILLINIMCNVSDLKDFMENKYRQVTFPFLLNQKNVHNKLYLNS